MPAFFIAIGLFPAYGFRPEAVPLVVLSIIIVLIRLPHILSTLGKGDNIEYSEGGIFFSFFGIVLLCAALVLAMAFSPAEIPAHSSRVYTFSARDGAGREYFFRVYRDQGEEEKTGIYGEKRPLLVLIPPLYGSTEVFEKLRGELLKRDFTVLTYSRRGFDAPALDGEGKTYGISPAEWFRRWRAFLSGAEIFRDNEWGRVLEKERKDDILFVLSRISLNPRLDEGLSLFDIAGRDSVFLGAYDAGASALIMLSGEGGFVSIRPFIKGIIAIEPPLWSAFTEEVREYEEPPPGASWFRRFWAGLGRRLDSLKAKKTAGPAALPPPGYPLLILASDRALDEPPSRRYEGIRLCLQRADLPVILAAMDGAGPLDYSDFPLKYPLVSAFFPGRRREAFKPSEAATGTASIIARFVFRVLEAETPAFQGLEVPPELPANFHIESRKALNLF
ncbi:MAG: hypothetical protein LBT87_04820 [Treponema sp.]|nr:hypothetical protein [Treponema sp.]